QQYCLPGFEETGLATSYIWSPDSRYLVFQARLPEDSNFIGAPLRTFVLDIETGSVTEISTLAGALVVWIAEGY
ncbi:MAG: hypothetical protein AAFN11_05155, partial [Chloroflexota bacterium]